MSRNNIKVPSLQTIRKAVQLALDEDLDHGDVTTSALFPLSIQARAAILAHQPMTVAGVAVAREVFLAVDPSLRIVKSINDGATVKPGTEVIVVRGDVRSWLMAERVAVNFLQQLSGIATLTAKFCAAIRHTETAILDTRKTTPGLRALEKWAVHLG
ncbi:MAG: nicotinate-nucleotide diphosphorylase (carboxylating), partial [Nitrospira sp.]